MATTTITLRPRIGDTWYEDGHIYAEVYYTHAGLDLGMATICLDEHITPDMRAKIEEANPWMKNDKAQ